MTDGVAVVGAAASPCAARGVVSSVIGRRPTASSSSSAATAPRLRAISRSGCSNTNCSNGNSTHALFVAFIYATRVDRDRGETVAGTPVTPGDNLLQIFFSDFTGAVRAAVTVYGLLRRDDTGARSRAFKRLSRAPPRVATYRIRNRSVPIDCPAMSCTVMRDDGCDVTPQNIYIYIL